jgi:carboxymethylenebutenolidase
MCYSDSARPPLPPVGGAASDHGDLRLKSADGTTFMAYAARSATPNGRGMVILPDVRGLHQFYKELAVRFSEAGFEAIAFDYFARTADTDDRGESFEWTPHVQQSTPESIAADVRACLNYLATPEGGSPASVFTVGFCFGGSTSWRQSANNPDLAGCIGFYGGRPLERVGPWIPQMRSPILMLLAGVDSTTPEEFEGFAGKVRAQGVEVESHTYPGAPHSFFDRTKDQWKDASDDAWRRILDFTERQARVTSGTG